MSTICEFVLSLIHSMKLTHRCVHMLCMLVIMFGTKANRLLILKQKVMISSSCSFFSISMSCGQVTYLQLHFICKCAYTLTYVSFSHLQSRYFSELWSMLSPNVHSLVRYLIWYYMDISPIGIFFRSFGEVIQQYT